MICAADLHITRVRPAARKDDWLVAMDRKLRFILGLARESPPLVVAGDLFDRPRPGDWILRYVIDLLREYGVVPVVVPGQHDLPYHSLDNLDDCGLGVLAAAGVITVLTADGGYLPNSVEEVEQNGVSIFGAAYGEEPRLWSPNSVLLWHHMVITQPLWPGQQADNALAVLRKYPQFDLIVTGDNHQSFCIAEDIAPDKIYSTRWLINPGSMMRRRIDQVGHRPCVFRWEPGHAPEQIFLPIDEDVLDLSVKEEAEGRDARIAALMEGLRLDPELGVAFEDNLKRYLDEARPSQAVVNLIHEMTGD